MPKEIPPKLLRVLVIDDEAMAGTSIARILGRRFEVRLVTEAAEALDLLRGDTHFDVVLCDLAMPGMTGIELHQALVLENHALADRMLFTTGGPTTEKAVKFVATFEERTLLKPFDQQRLVARIHELLERLSR